MRTRAILTLAAVTAGLLTLMASPARACATTAGPIVYVQQVGCDAALWVMQYDGSAPQQVTALASDTAHPSWSPDGTRIAYTAWTDQTTGDDIWIHDVTTNSSTAIPATTDHERMPDWSPDGSRIVFVRGWITSELWSMRPDGTDLVQITNLGANVSGPSWSPDGSTIVFAAYLNGRNDLHVIHPDGTGLLQITDSSTIPDSVMEPQWSPDGTKIVATAMSGHGSYLVTMNPDGTTVHQLTTSGCLFDTAPSFTIDGTHVLFTRADPFNATFSIPADGSAQAVELGPTGTYHRMMPEQSPPLVTTTTTTTAPVAATPRFTC